MGRPRKYASEADARAARLQQEAQRKRNKRAEDSAALNALKNDPTKRKDAAVNRYYPVSPVDASSREMIAAVLDVAGEFNPHDAFGSLGRKKLETCIALAAQWEDENKLRLPCLDQEGELILWRYQLQGVNALIEARTRMTYGERWNKLHEVMMFWAYWKKRDNKNKLRSERYKAKERTEADTAGISVSQLRANKEALAKSKWLERTQAECHNLKAETALRKRKARIERDDAARMEELDQFGRF